MIIPPIGSATSSVLPSVVSTTTMRPSPLVSCSTTIRESPIVANSWIFAASYAVSGSPPPIESRTIRSSAFAAAEPPSLTGLRTSENPSTGGVENDVVSVAAGPPPGAVTPSTVIR